MSELPSSLVYYGSYQGVLQMLKHQSLPLFQADELRDPFLPNKFSKLDFDCQSLFERSVKYMTSAILGKSAPKGNPNHPLQKAIKRWRGENRFSDESEIRESLVGLLPAMVEKSFNQAKDIQADWESFVERKRLLPLYENADNSELWLLEGERYAGIAVKFKCEESSVFASCEPVNYSKLPAKPVRMQDCVNLMVGDTQEINTNFESNLLAQNYDFRGQREWRLIVDKNLDDEFCLKFPSDLIQSVYIGAAVAKLKAEQIVLVCKQVNQNINVYQAECSENGYEFQFEKR
jgi:hypothetical protein